MAYIKELKVTFERKRVDDDLLKAPVESSTRVCDLFGQLQDETKEKVVVLHLNPQFEILSYEASAIGTAHRALIDAVEICRNAMLARKRPDSRSQSSLGRPKSVRCRQGICSQAQAVR